MKYFVSNFLNCHNKMFSPVDNKTILIGKWLISEGEVKNSNDGQNFKRETGGLGKKQKKQGEQRAKTRVRSAMPKQCNATVCRQAWQRP